MTWSTSDKKIATVDKNGKVKGVGAGTATIKATAKDGSKKAGSLKVKVYGIKYAHLTQTVKASTVKNKAKTITAKGNDAVTKVSINKAGKSIVTVKKSGKNVKITVKKGAKAGKTAKVTVTTKNGGKSVITVKVTK